MRIAKVANKVSLAVAAVCCVGLSGCAFFPSTGPSDSAVQQGAKAEHLPLVSVTPSLARQKLSAIKAREHQKNADALRALQSAYRPALVRLATGDDVQVTLLTQALLPGNTLGVSGSDTLRSNQLGSFTVDAAGSLHLPYIGRVHVAGVSLSQAETRIAQAYASSGFFQSPQVVMRLSKDRAQSVTVLGSARKPTVLYWRPGGVPLSLAIARSQGLEPSGQTARGNHLGKANQIQVVEHGQRFVLPFSLAEQANVLLDPGSRVILRRHTLVEVDCLGGGWNGDTRESFGHVPTLAEVLATGGGLSTRSAQGLAVFILPPSQRHIDKVSLDTLSGLRAAQSYPVENGSVVYVATSPSVKVQQVMQILFSPFYPAAAIKGATG